MNKTNVIFYNNSYYLLPSEYDSYEKFYSDVENGDELCLSTLMSGCGVPPYFIVDKVEENTIFLSNKKLLYSACVILLSENVYYTKLNKIIAEYCSGCVCSLPTGKCRERNDNFSRLSLVPICNDKESNIVEGCFADTLEYFWWNIKNCNIDYLISNNDTTSIVELFKTNLFAITGGTLVYAELDSGIVEVSISAMNNLLNFFLFKKLKQYMPIELESRICFNSFLKRDKLYNGSNYNSKNILFELLSENGKTILQASYCETLKSGEEHKFLEYVYLELCSFVGEDCLLSFIDEYTISSTPLSKGYSILEIKQIIDKFVLNKYFGTSEIIPSVTYSLKSSIPYKKDIGIVNASLVDISLSMQANYDYILSLIKDYSLKIGYLVFTIPKPHTGDGESFVSEFMTNTLNQILQSVKKSGSGGVIAIHIGENYLCVDMLIINYRKYLKTLFANVPIFLHFDAKWVECTKNGFEIYKIDYAHILEDCIECAG